MEFINYLKSVITVEISIIVLLTTVIIILAIVSFCCRSKSYFIAMEVHIDKDVLRRHVHVTHPRYISSEEILDKEIKNFANLVNVSQEIVVVASFNRI